MTAPKTKQVKRTGGRIKRLWLLLLSPFALLLTAAFLLLLVFTYLTVTKSGTETLIGLASDALPDLEIEGVDGALLDDLNIERILWKNDGIEVEVHDSKLKASFFPPRITIDTLAAKLITVSLPQEEKTKERSPFSIIFPDIHLPVDVELKNIVVDEMHIKQGDALIKLRDVKLSTIIEGDQLVLHYLSGDLYDDDGDISVSASGNMGLSTPHPLDLTILVSGDSRRIGVGTLELAAKGEVVDYQLTSKGHWKYANYPEYELDLFGTGNLEHLNVERLHLNGEAGEADLTGLMTWSPELNWDLELTGNGLNPGLFAKDYPGKLDMQWITTGSLAEKLSIQLELKKLEGSLQEYPIDADLKLSIEDEDITLKILRAKVGDNELIAEGIADESLDVKWQINAPLLSQLHESIKGKLIGSGTLSGKRDGSKFALFIDELKGNILDYPIDAKGGLRVDGDLITADDLQINVGDNHLKLNGSADEDQGIDWQLDAKKLVQLYPALNEKLSGKLKGEGNIKGLLDGSRAAIQIDRLKGNVTFNQQDYPIDARGYLKWQNQLVIAKNLILKIGTNTVELNGIANEDQGIDWRINANNLSQLHPDIKGSLIGDGNAKGLLDGSRGTLQINTLRGNLQDFSVKAKGQIKLHNKIVTAKDIVLEVGDNLLTLNGNTGESYGVDWTVNAQNIGQLYTGINASVKGNGKLSGELDGSAFKLGIAQLKGQYEGRPIKAIGNVSSESGKISVQKLEVFAGSNHLQVNGQASEPFDLSFNIDAPKLAEAWPGLGGSLKGSGSFKGNLDRPQIQADLKGKQLRYQSKNQNKNRDKNQDLSIGTLDIKADQRGETYTINAAIMNLKQGDNVIQKATIDGKGRLDKHTVKLSVHHKEGKLDLKANGGWSNKPLQRWKGQIQNLTLRDTVAGNWRLNSPISIKASATNVTSSQLCLSSDRKAQLCAEGQWSQVNNTIKAKGNLKQVPLNMGKPWMPDTLSLPGLVNGDFDVVLVNGKPKGTVDIRLPDSSVTFKNSLGKQETLRYSNTKANIVLTPTKANLKASLDINERGQLRAEGSVDIANDVQQSRLNLKANVKIPDIRWVQQFSNDIDELKGNLNGDVVIKGTIAKPSVTGSAQLKNASLFLPETGAKLQAINLNIKANRSDQMLISGSLKAGQGTLQAKGKLSLSNLPKWSADLSLKGERLLLMDTHEVQAQISPDLVIKASPSSIAITGTLRIPETTINLRQLPVSAKSRADDIVIVGRDGKIPTKTTQENEPVLNIHPNVVVELGDKVSFSGFGFRSKFTGRLRILKLRQDIIAQGTLNVIDGIFDAYGQQLEIDKGRLLFSGDIDNPGLDIRAIRRIPGDIIVGMALRGTAQAPQSELFSEPLQTETDTLTYLLTGNPASAATSGDSALLTSAISGLGIKGGDSMAQKMGGKFGLDNVGISSSTGNYRDSELSIGKKIGSKLYVKYIVGLFDSLQKVAVTYQINERLQAEVLTGGTQQEIDLHYKIETNKGLFGR